MCTAISSLTNSRCDSGLTVFLLFFVLTGPHSVLFISTDSHDTENSQVKDRCIKGTVKKDLLNQSVLKLWTRISYLDWALTCLKGSSLGLHRSGLVLVLMSSVETLYSYQYLLIPNSYPASLSSRERQFDSWVSFLLAGNNCEWFCPQLKLLCIHLAMTTCYAARSIDSLCIQTDYDWYYSDHRVNTDLTKIRITLTVDMHILL